MILFINAAFRDDSRTLKLAKKYLSSCRNDEIISIELGDLFIEPLNRNSLKIYNSSVSSSIFNDDMFDIAKQFSSADEIVIAAPFYNFSFPAVLHSYLELVCTQGINFDVSENGAYYTLCKAKKLTYITTAGGYIPENDHAFCYIKKLAETFWGIDNINYYKADGLDIKENDPMQLLKDAMSKIG